MAINRTREKVRDGYLGDLPEPIRVKVMNIHKLIKSTVDSLIDEDAYQDLKDSRWAMSCVDEFCAMPKDKSDVGSVRVFKSGKTYRCMIQVTGHFRNHQYGWIEELLHDFIGNVFTTIRPKIRKQYDMTITNEGRTGNPFEGFSVYPNTKQAKDIWDLFEDKKIKTVTECGEIDADDLLLEYDVLFREDMSLGDYLMEKSQGKLNTSFRMAVNPENGHFIRIIFDLNPKDVVQIGDHANQSGRDAAADKAAAANIKKTGHNNFSSIGTVKAIIDVDTKEKLQSVKTIGVIGSNSNTTRFTVPEKFKNPKLKDEASTFSAYPVKVREQIAAELKLNPPDAITYTVGETEKVPSYKATRIVNSISDLYNNQWAKGRGIQKSGAMTNTSIKTGISKMEQRINALVPLVKGNEDAEDDLDLVKRQLSRLKKVAEQYKDENFGQTTRGSQYAQLYRSLDINVSDLEHDLKKTEHTDVDIDDELFIEKTDDGTTIDCGLKKLPKGLSPIITDLNNGIRSLIDTMSNQPEYADFAKNHDEVVFVLKFMVGRQKKGEVGRTIITKHSTGYSGEIQITPMPDSPLCKVDAGQKQLRKMLSAIKRKMAPEFNKKNPGKKLILTGPKDQEYFIIALEPSYAEKLYNYIKSPKTHPMKEAAENPVPQYNTDMSEAEAKRTMRTLTQSLINDFKSNKSKKMTQYTANIYANIITKNLLPNWAPSFRKFSITLDDYQSFHTVEFKIPKMTQDFVDRFIHGRENLDGFLHRQAEIKLKMSPRVFHTMKSPDDAYNFFKAAINYYDKKVGKAGEKLMAEAMRLSPSIKHLVGNSKLSGIVTLPMTLLFVFDDVDMSKKDTFQLSQEDVRTVSSFIRNIPSHYAAPEKEKKQIVDDVQKMVKTLREACSMDENLAELNYLPEAVKNLFAGRFDKEMKEASATWEDGNVDYMGMRQHKDPKVKVLTEAFGVKKLKKIPADLVAYIQIETESIKDANDKMMISSYCLSKIEIVEWYIELLNVGSKKYVVPHTKPWLENMRTQLLACFKKIMATPIPKADRPLFDIKYPAGYEG